MTERMKNLLPSITQSHASCGLLVLGMHRSGTSALARVLDLCGADIGTRVLGVSAGNETGHWEDAFAVEEHERLLAAFGSRWDDPFALPAGWQETEVGRNASRSISSYVHGDRSQHHLWAVKDPRLCLFSEVWIEAARKEGQEISAVLLLRHPMEVARSLMVRDGIALGRGLLLWLEYSLAALKVAERVPTIVVSYENLLSDWKYVVEKIRTLPGGESLTFSEVASKEIEIFLDSGLRHHHVRDDGMPQLVHEAWELLSACVGQGLINAGAAEQLAGKVASLRELLHPVLDDWRVARRQLWERIGHAEAHRNDAVSIPAELSALRDGLQMHHADLMGAFTVDVQRMQEVTAQAIEVSSALTADNRLAHSLAPRLDTLSSSVTKRLDDVVSLVGEDMRALREQIQRLATDSQVTEVRLCEVQEQLLNESAARDVAEKELGLHVQQALIVRHELEQLRGLAGQLNRLKLSRSWRWTRPLRVIARLLTGKWAASDAAKLRSALRRTANRIPFLGNGARAKLAGLTIGGGAGAVVEDLPDDSVLDMFVLEGQSDGLPDIFVWAVIDWHFRLQRPQHIARALAEKGHRVFYVSNNFVDQTEPGFHVDRLDGEGRLFQLHLNLSGAPSIYLGMPHSEQVEALRDSLGRVLQWTCTRSAVSLVQHPYWSELAHAVPSARLVYDCMDHHGGFENNADAIVDAENRLIERSDLVVVTSSWLEDEIAPRARATAMVRNAGEFEFFRDPPARVFVDDLGRKVIGYYGAIAEWFDPGLVRAVAAANPSAIVILVGNDTASVGQELADMDNVLMVGEVPYRELPYWLHGFDVCLLPFRVIPLTLATNPVKVYEYLAAGKAVVSVDLPEMVQFRGLVRTANNTAEFVNAVNEILADPRSDRECVGSRQIFASGQTWAHRAKALDDAIAMIAEPKVSVIVLTYNNLAFTENCLFSIEAYSDYKNLEVIVVDNASTDGSPEWLRKWQSEVSTSGHTRVLILNPENLGFSAGNNVGLHAATGEVLIILNNDTYVTPGWVRGLGNHVLRNESLGLVGPVTNNIGNEARIDIAYANMAEMIHNSSAYTRQHPGKLLLVRNAAFFCVAMRRGVYERVGEMDESFGIGFFEDDDYCRRVEKEGLLIGCADDVFVHHHLSASFDALKADLKKELFDRNKAIYEAKWGPWIPHSYRSPTPTI